MSEGISFYVKQETELLIYYLLIIIKILIDIFRTLNESNYEMLPATLVFKWHPNILNMVNITQHLIDCNHSCH